jgi:hypothetical protein
MDKKKRKFKKKSVDQGLAATSTDQGKAFECFINPNSSINPPDLNNQFCKDEKIDLLSQSVKLDLEGDKNLLIAAGTALNEKQFYKDNPEVPKFDPNTGQIKDYLTEGKTLKEHSQFAAKRGEGTALFGDDYPGTLETGGDQ